MSNTTRLLDRKKLIEIHPALGKRYRLEWLTRTRQIPVIKIGRRIYFDELEIQKWIESQKIPAQGVD